MLARVPLKFAFRVIKIIWKSNDLITMKKTKAHNKYLFISCFSSYSVRYAHTPCA